jgi:MFS transporter, DHA1 family, tetracycline resistance protein
MEPQRSARTVLALVAFIVFMDMMGVGLIIPVLPGLIAELGHTGIDGAAVVGGTILFAYALMQFICAPIIGGLSDRFGRRPVLLFTLAAMSVDYMIMFWAPSLAWLVIGRLISGAMGATWPAANSCVADAFPAEERGAKFGLLGGAGASGFVLGPAIGGMLGEFGLRLPFLAASGFAAAGALAGYFLFAETLPTERRRAFTIGRANPFGTILQMTKIPLVIGLLSVIFLSQLASQSQISTWAYFLIARFNWSPLEIGISVAAFGLLLGFSQGFLTGKVIPRFGERRAALAAMCMGLPSYLILAFASSGWMVYAGIVVGSLSGVAFPAFQSMMSHKIDEDAQGELQGAIASLISLTSIIGPLVMSRVFQRFADAKGIWFPGAPFILAAGLSVIALLVCALVLRRYGEAPSPQSQSSSQA